jgi:O-antigen ligase
MALAVGRVAAAVLGATVFAFACGSSIVDPVLVVGRPARWVVLVALLAVSALYAFSALPPRMPALFVGCVGALGALAVVSAMWSVDTTLTLKRAASFEVLLLTGVCLLAATARDRDAVRELLLAIVVAAVAVGLAGLCLLAVSWQDAVQPATTAYPARYRGFEQNPNTAAILFAVATPLAVIFALEPRSRRERVLALAAVCLFAGSIAASGARGPLLAALAGTLAVLPAAGGTWRRRLLLAALAGTVFAVCLGLSQIPQPKPTRAEAGRPSAHVLRRTLFTSSGRLGAWRGALHQVRARPISGYGFGTEQTVFVNRYAGFASDLPENSYIGASLQIGIAGLLLLLAVVAAAAGLLVRALRRGGRDVLLAGCAGAIGAALVVAVTQSYVLAVGNIATVAVWTCVFLLAAAASGQAEARASSRSISSSETSISHSG